MNAKHFGEVVQGHWTKEEQQWSINTKELVAAERTIKAYLKWARLKECAIRLMTDSIVTMVYLNKMGGRWPHLREVAARLLKACEQQGVHLVAEHLPGVKNTWADTLSRLPKDRSDWRLDRRIFQLLEQKWGPHTIDWFATRVNTQLPRFASWTADSRCSYVDAIRNLHKKENGYANPPFSAIGMVLQKLRTTRRSLTLVVPSWPAQHWWPLLLDLMIDLPVLLPHHSQTFTPSEVYGVSYKAAPPPWGTFAFRLSGDCTKRIKFRKRCQVLLFQGGQKGLLRTMVQYGTNGLYSPGARSAIRSILMSLWSSSS